MSIPSGSIPQSLASVERAPSIQPEAEAVAALGGNAVAVASADPILSSQAIQPAAVAVNNQPLSAARAVPNLSDLRLAREALPKTDDVFGVISGVVDRFLNWVESIRSSEHQDVTLKLSSFHDSLASLNQTIKSLDNANRLRTLRNEDSAARVNVGGIGPQGRALYDQMDVESEQRYQGRLKASHIGLQGELNKAETGLNALKLAIEAYKGNPDNRHAAAMGNVLKQIEFKQQEIDILRESVSLFLGQQQPIPDLKLADVVAFRTANPDVSLADIAAMTRAGVSAKDFAVIQNAITEGRFVSGVEISREELDAAGGAAVGKLRVTPVMSHAFDIITSMRGSNPAQLVTLLNALPIADLNTMLAGYKANGAYPESRSDASNTATVASALVDARPELASEFVHLMTKLLAEVPECTPELRPSTIYQHFAAAMHQAHNLGKLSLGDVIEQYEGIKKSMVAQEWNEADARVINLNAGNASEAARVLNTGLSDGSGSVFTGAPPAYVLNNGVVQLTYQVVMTQGEQGNVPNTLPLKDRATGEDIRDASGAAVRVPEMRPAPENNYQDELTTMRLVLLTQATAVAAEANVAIDPPDSAELGFKDFMRLADSLPSSLALYNTGVVRESRRLQDMYLQPETEKVDQTLLLDLRRANGDEAAIAQILQAKGWAVRADATPNVLAQQADHQSALINDFMARTLRDFALQG